MKRSNNKQKKQTCHFPLMSTSHKIIITIIKSLNIKANIAHHSNLTLVIIHKCLVSWIKPTFTKQKQPHQIIPTTINILQTLIPILHPHQ